MGDFFSALCQGFSQLRALRGFYGLELVDSAASSSSFCRPARTLAMEALFFSDGLAFSFGRNTVFWATAANFMAPAMSVRPPRVRTHSFLSIHLPHLPWDSESLWTSVCLVALFIPNCPYAVSVRQVRDLPRTFLQIPPHGAALKCRSQTFPRQGQSRNFHS